MVEKSKCFIEYIDSESKYTDRGYVMVYKPEHPNSRRGNIEEHRLVMEKHLGRYLIREELVHHKNGNRSDNRIENLQLMTRSEHTNHHNIEKRNRDIINRICNNCKSNKTQVIIRKKKNKEFKTQKLV